MSAKIRVTKLMTKVQLVNELRASMKISDVERWWMGDLCAAQPWLNKEELEDVADQAGIGPATLKKYIDTAKEFPSTERDANIPWGAYQQLSSVVSSKDRQIVLESKDDNELWTPTSMGIKVREHLRRTRAEKVNQKRMEKGLDPLLPQAKPGVYRAEKTGCNLMGITLHAEYNKKAGSMEFVLDLALENISVDTLGGKTRLVGIVPFPDVEDEEGQD